MKKITLILNVFLILISQPLKSQINQLKIVDLSIDNVEAFKDTLSAIANHTTNELFALSCKSMLKVINAKNILSADDEFYLNHAYLTFIDDFEEGCPANVDSYLQRQRPFIIAWESPTDGQVSFSWLKLPNNWNPDETYPLYVQLHGYWNVAANDIQYMTYPYINGPSSTYAFNDGYLLSPWGRGNLWYEGISETDIWECVDALELEVNINPQRKYLCGHSMGGYGAWNLGQKSPEIWAALGIHSGALWYTNNELVSTEVAFNLRETPVYFVCGTYDDLLEINLSAYALLEDTGNPDIEFVTFEGGHEYRDEDVEGMYDWMVNVTTSLSEPTTLINRYDIQIQPNPFSNQTKIEYNLSKTENVSIDIYNCFGQLVDVVLDIKQISGFQSTIWQPKKLAKGIYFCHIKIGDTNQCKRLVLH